MNYPPVATSITALVGSSGLGDPTTPVTQLVSQRPHRFAPSIGVNPLVLLLSFRTWSSPKGRVYSQNHTDALSDFHNHTTFSLPVSTSPKSFMAGLKKRHPPQTTASSLFNKHPFLPWPPLATADNGETNQLGADLPPSKKAQHMET